MRSCRLQLVIGRCMHVCVEVGVGVGCNRGMHMRERMDGCEIVCGSFQLQWLVHFWRALNF